MENIFTSCFPGMEGGPDIIEDFGVSLLPDVPCYNNQAFASHFMYGSNCSLNLKNTHCDNTRSFYLPPDCANQKKVELMRF